MTIKLLPSIYVEERVVVTFIYTDELEVGETLTGIVGSPDIQVIHGEDSSPSDLLNGTPLVDNEDGNVVFVPIKGHLAGVGYIIKVTCNTTNSQKRLTRVGKIYVF